MLRSITKPFEYIEKIFFVNMRDLYIIIQFIASHQVGLLQSVDITCVDFYHNITHKIDNRAPSSVGVARFADINTDAIATGGGPALASILNDWDRRFLTLLGPGFGQTAPHVMAQPLSDEQAPTSSRAESEVILVKISRRSTCRGTKIREERPHVPSQPCKKIYCLDEAGKEGNALAHWLHWMSHEGYCPKWMQLAASDAANA
ncbi:hypothetical protein evm_006828 [Chilo suppressalis]|nr:hypothetical protein evm_006828 [Chilo suppressalis]